MPMLKFDPQALYEAIDAQRRERGMTWNELANELCVSASTIKGMTKRQYGIELDGVMGMTRWLGRTVESFAGGDGGPSKSGVFRSEEHTSELQSLRHLVCRLLLEKQK